MNHKLLDNKDFVNCLRIQIFPDEHAAERIEAVKRFCLRYSFQNVMLFLNAEEMNLGHIEKEEARPWIETMKQAKKSLEEAGLTVSLNPWIEIGHLDRGRTLKKDQPFQTMVDRFGNQCKMVACPSDPVWKKYYLSLMEWYVGEIQPAVLWIEDDFRLHNHAPLDFGGCFCPHHMELYCAKLGHSETREEFVKALSSGEPTPERKAFLDVSWETMDSLAKSIAAAVHKAAPECSVGLMSSASWSHETEGRRWHELHQDLSSDGVLIDRPHIPVYEEGGAKCFYYYFNRTSMVNRTFLGDEVKIYPECENGAFSTYIKDPRFLTFEVESSLPVGLDGMTYDIFDFVGNGPIPSFHYGEAIASIQPYLNAVKALELRPSQLRGLSVHVDELSSYHVHADSFYEIPPADFDGISTLSGLGVSYRPTMDKGFHNEACLLIGSNVRNFSAEELKDLFAHNHVYVDGKAVMELKTKGLLSLLGAEDATLYNAFSGHLAYEELNKGRVNGIENYRATAQEKAGEYALIRYTKPVKEVTSVYTPERNKFGPGTVSEKGFFINPFGIGCQSLEQFHPLRRELLFRDLRAYASQPLALSDYEGVNPYLYEQKGRYVLFLTNTTWEDFPILRFELLNLPISKIERLSRKTGKAQKVSFVRHGNRYVLDSEFAPLSTACLLLYPERKAS